MKMRHKLERNYKIFKLREDGLSLEAIAKKFSISRERVRQVFLNTEILKNRLDSIKKRKEINYLDNLTRPISDLCLTVRIYHSFIEAGIKTIGDITEKPPEYFLKLHGFGRRSLIDLEGELSEFGLSLNHKYYCPFCNNEIKEKSHAE